MFFLGFLPSPSLARLSSRSLVSRLGLALSLRFRFPFPPFPSPSLASHRLASPPSHSAVYPLVLAFLHSPSFLRAPSPGRPGPVIDRHALFSFGPCASNERELCAREWSLRSSCPARHISFSRAAARAACPSPREMRASAPRRRLSDSRVQPAFDSRSPSSRARCASCVLPCATTSRWPTSRASLPSRARQPVKPESLWFFAL